MNQAHEQIANVGSVLGLIKQGIFSMQNSLLQGSLADVVV